MSIDPQMEKKIWRAMKVNNKFSVADISRLTGASSSYVNKKIREFKDEDYVNRAGLKDPGTGTKEKLWRLTLRGKNMALGLPLPPKSTRLDLAPEYHNLNGQNLKGCPENILWKAIKELHEFIVDDLVAMELANITTTRQYLSLLTRAGFLKKNMIIGPKGMKNKVLYQLIQDPGPIAPIMGRAPYLYDANSDKLWSEIPEGAEIRKRCRKVTTEKES